MSMMKKYISIAVILLLAASCDKEHDFAQENPNEITVEASMGGTRATLTHFEEGDRMSLYAVEYNGDEVAEVQPSGNYLNNEQMSYDGAKWTSGRTLYWSENPCDFYGFYPYQPTASMNDILYEVEADQSQPSADGVLGGYEKSDLMWAKATSVTRADGTVHLQFRHMMTRLMVDIVRGPKFEGELPEDIDVHIYNTATSAFVDWRIGSVEVNHQGGHKTIKMRQVDEDTFDAIVVPQFIQRRTPLVEITMEGIAYLLESSISLRPGKQHTFTVTLNTSPDQEKIEISIDGEVGEWE